MAWSLRLSWTDEAVLLPHLLSFVRTSIMSDTCAPHHDWFNNVLTFGLCMGLVGSYLPQHVRIIRAKSSEGISVFFLFLGVGSTTSSMFNMITLQAPIVRCCRVVSFGSCLEITAGVIQMTLQSICFGLIFVLYMIYYPQYMKYVDRNSEEAQLLSPPQLKQPVKSRNWQVSVTLAWAAAIHFVLAASITTYLLLSIPDLPEGAQSPVIQAWATILGVSSVIMAMIQYTPQLIHTFRLKHVGALSIPMMIIQTPGGILMVISIALRPGTNWTSWITFLVSAMLQGCLLFMCILWKIRQRRLNVDDFGNPLPTLAISSDEEISELPDPSLTQDASSSAAQVILAQSEGSVLFHEDRLHPTQGASPLPGLGDSEEAPLLKRDEPVDNIQGKTKLKGWSAWFER